MKKDSPHIIKPICIIINNKKEVLFLLFLVKGITFSVTIITMKINFQSLKKCFEVTDTTTSYTRYTRKNYDYVWFVHCPI